MPPTPPLLPLTVQPRPPEPPPPPQTLTTFHTTLLLALTCFGGPQATALVHDLLIIRRRWATDRAFAALFALGNALPGPLTTKLVFALASGWGGVACGVLGVLVWSLPGALVMTFVAHTLARLTPTTPGSPSPTPDGTPSLPAWLPDLQNGLSTVAVALVALTAYRMAGKLLPRGIDRAVCVAALAAVVNLSGAGVVAGVMAVGGIVGVLAERRETEAGKEPEVREREGEVVDETTPLVAKGSAASAEEEVGARASRSDAGSSDTLSGETPDASDDTDAPPQFGYSVRTGTFLLLLSLFLFLLSLLNLPPSPSPSPSPTPVVVPLLPRLIAIATLLHFTGLISFGGSAVLVTLLHAHAVPRGWCSDAEFLLGYAVANAVPGPVYNFGAFLGALAAVRGGAGGEVGWGTAMAGGLVGYAAVTFPGVVLMAGVLPFWGRFGSVGWVKAAFKGFNAASVGLLFASTYLLLEKAIVSGDSKQPTSLLSSGFYTSVAAVAFAVMDGGAVSAPAMVVLGAGVGAGAYAWRVFGGVA
ncbi:hypothetical protein HDU96_002614 [Phlyctochytrium bullatum]|nr:hypothetical protein HDU96_002614 [Phlyctochytrium bullatum]